MEIIGRMRNKFYTADMHLDHENVIRLSKRPFDGVLDMAEKLIDNWNSVVRKSDDVYHLGDFCFNSDNFLENITKLNGNLHFLTGNHDKKAINKLIRMKENGNKKLKNVFFHGDMHEIKDGDNKLVLCHYPIYEWNGWHKGAIHLHGHCHGNQGASFKDRAYDVGTDCRNYTPVLLEELLA